MVHRTNVPNDTQLHLLSRLSITVPFEETLSKPEIKSLNAGKARHESTISRHRGECEVSCRSHIVCEAFKHLDNVHQAQLTLLFTNI